MSLSAQVVARLMVQTFYPQKRSMLKTTSATVRICRIELSIENGVSSPQKIEYALVKHFIRDVEDLKFADDTELIIAGHAKCKIQNRF